MDYGELAAKLTSKYFPKLGSIADSCIYQEMSEGTYNPESGEYSNEAVFSQEILVMFASFSLTITLSANAYQGVTPIEKTDMIASFPTIDLSVKASLGATLTDSNNDLWKVVGIDRTSAITQMHVRRV